MTDRTKIEFFELFILLCKNHLKIREIKCILWHYACKKTYREITRLDGRGVTHQAIHEIIKKARKKILLKNT